MAKQITVWEDSRGKAHRTEEGARRADAIAAIEQMNIDNLLADRPAYAAGDGLTNVAGWIVDNAAVLRTILDEVLTAPGANTQENR